jgi:hypothetical protein
MWQAFACQGPDQRAVQGPSILFYRLSFLEKEQRYLELETTWKKKHRHRLHRCLQKKYVEEDSCPHNTHAAHSFKMKKRKKTDLGLRPFFFLLQINNN